MSLVMPLLLEEYYKDYTKHLQDLMKTVDLQVLEDVLELLFSAREKGNTIFFAGNGGSASTASHFAQDLAMIGRKLKVKPFKSMSLTDNVSFITASGNDYGYETVFTTQMEVLFHPGDVLITISASGNSPNVVAATSLAKQKGGKSVALVGFDGGKLKQLSDYAVHVRSEKGEYGIVEDCHSILNHFLTNLITLKLKDQFTAATLRPDRELQPSLS